MLATERRKLDKAYDPRVAGHYPTRLYTSVCLAACARCVTLTEAQQWACGPAILMAAGLSHTMENLHCPAAPGRRLAAHSKRKAPPAHSDTSLDSKSGFEAHHWVSSAGSKGAFSPQKELLTGALSTGSSSGCSGHRIGHIEELGHRHAGAAHHGRHVPAIGQRRHRGIEHPLWDSGMTPENPINDLHRTPWHHYTMCHDNRECDAEKKTHV